MTSGIRVDPHVKILDESVVNRAKAAGLDAIVYAPHFTPLPAIEAAADRYSEPDLAVIPGREVFTGRWRNRKHVLALDLEAPVPDFIDLEAAMAEFARQEAVVLVPHPGFLTVSLGTADVERFRAAIHAIETYNPKHLPSHNRTARRISDASGRPAFGSSYAHLHGSIGEVWTTFPDLEPTQSAILEAFRTGRERTVGHRRGLGHRVRCGLEFAHLFYENSWAKFDRVVLSGREPTHPSQPLYEERFVLAED